MLRQSNTTCITWPSNKKHKKAPPATQRSSLSLSPSLSVSVCLSLSLSNIPLKVNLSMLRRTSMTENSGCTYLTSFDFIHSHLVSNKTSNGNGVYASTCESCGHFFKFRKVGSFKTSISFTVNGKQYTGTVKNYLSNSKTVWIAKFIKSGYFCYHSNL